MCGEHTHTQKQSLLLLPLACWPIGSMRVRGRVCVCAEALWQALIVIVCVFMFCPCALCGIHVSYQQAGPIALNQM